MDEANMAVEPRYPKYLIDGHLLRFSYTYCPFLEDIWQKESTIA
jgi:hypothetical protein